MVYLKQSLVILVVWVSVFIFLAAINNVLANFFYSWAQTVPGVSC